MILNRDCILGPTRVPKRDPCPLDLPEIWTVARDPAQVFQARPWPRSPHHAVARAPAPGFASIWVAVKELKFGYQNSGAFESFDEEATRVAVLLSG